MCEVIRRAEHPQAAKRSHLTAARAFGVLANAPLIIAVYRPDEAFLTFIARGYCVKTALEPIPHAFESQDTFRHHQT